MSIPPAVGSTQCYIHPSFFPHQMVAPQGLVGAEATSEYLLLIAGCSIQGYRSGMLCLYLNFVKKNVFLFGEPLG